MKRACFVVAATVLAASTFPEIVRAADQEFLCGADVTMLTKVEEAGGTFSVNGEKKDALEILRSKGINAIRLRLFVAPNGKGPLVCDLDYMQRLAQRVKKAGLKFLLDIHYSDTWADPGHQVTPAAWATLGFPELQAQVKRYTQDCVAKLCAAGAAPDYIQIGNETNMGMLWPVGKTADSEGWDRFAALVRAGADGARAALGPGATTRFIHHVADPKNVVWHMDNFFKHGGETDIIGISWYPVGSGSFEDFRKRLGEISTRYNKDVVIAETDYPWTTHGFDGCPDILSSKAPGAGMPDYTPEGQSDFLYGLIAAIKDAPAHRGVGFFYWEATWLPSKRFGSPTDNTNLFDDKGAALPALDVLSLPH